jgi:tRNA(adenine34) deaminase
MGKRNSTRRVKQLVENKDWITSLTGTEVRKGYQLVLLQMGVPESECPIIEETELKITWHAYDFCPYLAATNELRMDTRTVCKCLTESPVQALLNILNPNLHFSRNYDKIRPYSEYCEETIELIDNC